MANYKDIITGTLNSLVEKAKDAAKSDAVTGFTEKVRSTAENTGILEVYQKGAAKTKAYGSIAKLMLKENGETEELKKVYTEIVKLYYEQAHENPQGFFVPLFAQVEEITAKIRSMDGEIEDLRSSLNVENDVEVEICDFDKVVSADEDENKGE